MNMSSALTRPAGPLTTTYSVGVALWVVQLDAVKNQPALAALDMPAASYGIRPPVLAFTSVLAVLADHQSPGLTTFIRSWLPVQYDVLSSGLDFVPTGMCPSIAPATSRTGTIEMSPPRSSHAAPH